MWGDLVGARNDVIEAISEIAKSRASLLAFSGQLASAGDAWLQEVVDRTAGADNFGVTSALSELTAVVNALTPQVGRQEINRLLGRALGLGVKIERQADGASRLLGRLLGARLADQAREAGVNLLVLNPGQSSTRVCWIAGTQIRNRDRVANQPGLPDTAEMRAYGVFKLMQRWGLDRSAVAGVTTRSGYLKPVPPGSYRVVPQMAADLTGTRGRPGDELSIPLALTVAEACGGDSGALVVVSDPLSSDELDITERLTGIAGIRRTGQAAHFLNHKAAWRLIASWLKQEPKNLDAVTAHLGSAGSIARHRDGRIQNLIDTFSGIPSPNHCGTIPVAPLLSALMSNDLNVKELQETVYSRGGLLSLAGTDDFRALIGFRRHGANRLQREKVDILLDFFAHRIAIAIAELASVGGPVGVITISGGLTQLEELAGLVEASLAIGPPLVWMGGSLADEAMAAGLVQSFHRPETIKDYVAERDALAKRRLQEDELLDVIIFERPLLYKKPGEPVTSAVELVDAARIAVHGRTPPVIGMVGADNEEALLAAKRANKEGRYKIAKFQLVGDSVAINEMAYEFDLMIDDDNYSIVDTDTPVTEAIRQLEAGRADILMKGNVKTEELLHGVFRYLKKSGQLQPGQLLSHVVVMDLPRMSKLLMITDAAVNPYPDEAKKVQIIENALRVARCLDILRPQVAVISAIEAVNVGIESSIEAERIASHFEDRDDCVVEGPLSFDVAVDPAIAEEKHYQGRIRGTADILIMPDIDAANVLYKTLTVESGATAAGVILCGDLPIVLTSRGDSPDSKLVSIALAVKIFIDMHEKGKKKTTQT
jgi:butyrate kinase